MLLFKLKISLFVGGRRWFGNRQK